MSAFEKLMDISTQHQKELNAPDLVGLGYCSWDYLCIVPEIPLDQKVEIVRSLNQGGGPSATATFAAQRLGAKTAYIGAVGDDEAGQNILREFAEAGVDVSGMIERIGATSGVSYCWADQKQGKRSIAWARGTAKPLRADEVNLELVRSCKVLHLDGHQTEAAIYAASEARAAGVSVCLDAGTMVPGIESILENTDIVIASEWFAGKYTGEATLEDQLVKLKGPRTRWVVATCGDNGSMGYDGHDFVTVPAFNVNVVDTTGAGDVFHGAFLHSYLRGGDLTESMRFASGAAALKCEQMGGRTGIPTFEQLKTFLKQQTKNL